MSTLNVSNITDGTDTVETGYVVNGSAKAWAFINQLSGNTIDNSFNVTSFSDLGTGQGNINLTNAMASATQVSQLTSYRSGTMDSSGNSGNSMTNSASVIAITKTSPGAVGDIEYGMTLHGDLA